MIGVDNYINPTATVGETSQVWRWSHVDADAVVGENCVVGQGVFIGKGCTVGDYSRFQNGAIIYEADLGECVFIGPNAVITDNPMPRIGFPNPDKHLLRTTVGRGASLGANATVVSGAKIGACAFIGANAVVTKDVPDNALMVGAPARQVGWICRCGARSKDLTKLCHSNSD